VKQNKGYHAVKQFEIPDLRVGGKIVRQYKTQQVKHNGCKGDGSKLPGINPAKDTTKKRDKEKGDNIIGVFVRSYTEVVEAELFFEKDGHYGYRTHKGETIKKETHLKMPEWSVVLHNPAHAQSRFLYGCQETTLNNRRARFGITNPR
jgi:hypothetical protein